MINLLPIFLTVLSTVSAFPRNNNIGATVNLRVEGLTRTIFEGQVFTTNHSIITTAAGGSHHCDGTNNHANPNPGPTCTGALVDARVRFDGTFDTTFDDYFIMSIGGDAQTATQFWGVLRNGQFTPVGGCQQEVVQNDNILWQYDAFNKRGFLKMVVQRSQQYNGVISRNMPLTLLVTDGASGRPISGANVLDWRGGQAGRALGTTDTNGLLVITGNLLKANQLFNGARLKADLTGYGRSNSVSVNVRGML